PARSPAAAASPRQRLSRQPAVRPAAPIRPCPGASPAHPRQACPPSATGEHLLRCTGRISHHSGRSISARCCSRRTPCGSPDVPRGASLEAGIRASVVGLLRLQDGWPGKLPRARQPGQVSGEPQVVKSYRVPGFCSDPPAARVVRCRLSDKHDQPRHVWGSMHPDQAGTSCFDTAQCVDVDGAALDVAAAGDDRAGTIVLMPAAAGAALDDGAATAVPALVVAGAGTDAAAGGIALVDAGAAIADAAAGWLLDAAFATEVAGVRVAGCPLLLFDGRVAAGTAGDSLTRVSAVQWKYAHTASPTSTSSTTRRPAREGAGAAAATASGVIGMKDSGSSDARVSCGGSMSESSCAGSSLSTAGTVIPRLSGGVGITGRSGGIAWRASSPLTASSGSSAASPKSFHVSGDGGVVVAWGGSPSALPASSSGADPPSPWAESPGVDQSLMSPSSGAGDGPVSSMPSRSMVAAVAAWSTGIGQGNHAVPPCNRYDSPGWMNSSREDCGSGPRVVPLRSM